MLELHCYIGTPTFIQRTVYSPFVINSLYAPMAESKKSQIDADTIIQTLFQHSEKKNTSSLTKTNYKINRKQIEKKNTKSFVKLSCFCFAQKEERR